MSSSYVVPAPCILPKISQLSSRVWRIMGLNPSPMTLGGTNTFLVGTGRTRILIDSGEGVPEYSQLLQDVIARTNTESISHLLLTHWHPDHISPTSAKQVLDLFPECKIAKATSRVMPNEILFASTSSLSQNNNNDNDNNSLLVFPPSTFMDIVSDSTSAFRTEGATIRAIFTRGHSDDHLCFHLEEENAIFTGDTILGYGSSVFASFPDFIASLEHIKNLNPVRIYPAHGPTPSMKSPENTTINIEEEQKITSQYISDYVNHRWKRMAQVVNYLTEMKNNNTKENDVDLMTMVDGIYGDQIAGQPKLRMGAAGNTLHILKKLVKEGKVAVDFSQAQNEMSTEEALAILDPTKDYANDVYLARLAASHGNSNNNKQPCSCTPGAQNLLLEKVEKFKWKLQ